MYKKPRLLFLFVLCLMVSNIPITAQATTNAEKLQQIESLLKIVASLQQQLKGNNASNDKAAFDSGQEVEVPLIQINGNQDTTHTKVDSYLNPLKNNLKFESDLSNCTPRKSFKKEWESQGLFRPTNEYVIVGISNGKCRIKYTNTFVDVLTKKTAHKVKGYCNIADQLTDSYDVLGDPLELSSMLPYITSLHKKEESKRSKIQQSIYDLYTDGDYDDFVRQIEEENYSRVIKCKVKSAY